MGKKCPNINCGYAENAPEWEFCGRCGTDLAASEEVSKIVEVKTIYDRPEIPAYTREIGAPALLEQATGTKLLAISSGRTVNEFAVRSESCIIGRWDAGIGAMPDVDLSNIDPDSLVSRHHARITRKGERYFIEDLGSKNGTFVNKGRKLNPNALEELKNGDEIIVGKTCLKFIMER